MGTPWRAPLLRCARYATHVAHRTDLAFLLDGVRPTVLLDYPVPHTEKIVEALRTQGLYAPDGPLALIELENFTFAINIPRFLDSTTNLSLDRLIFIAVDSTLAYPELLASPERTGLCQQLVHVRELISAAFSVPRLQSQAISIPIPSAHLLIPFSGWLLGYPVAYCFRDYSAVGGKTCLTHIPLQAITVTARQSDGTVMEVMRFTVPSKHWTSALRDIVTMKFKEMQSRSPTFPLNLTEDIVELSQVAM